MSLRLLLADESPSIKKAFELALQDFGIKIQTVHQGSDLPELFASFNPDICFLDIMLQKVNGYDSSRILKLDESSKEIPVVLMWSGFMELDPEKYRASLADGSIEKPFETSTLRNLVTELVPHLNQNEISDHLVFDENLISDDEVSGELKLSNSSEDEVLPAVPPLKEISFDTDDSGTNDDLTDPGFLADSPEIPDMPDFDSILNDDPPSDETHDAPEGLDFGSLETDDWKETPQDENMFKSPEGLDDVDSFSLESLDDASLPFETPEDTDVSIDDEVTGSIDLPPIPEQIVTAPIEQEPVQEMEALNSEAETSKKDLDELKLDVSNIPQLSKEELKRLILAQSKDIIESVVWDVVPELAKEMIQKEIQRLTGEIKYEGDLR